MDSTAGSPVHQDDGLMASSDLATSPIAVSLVTVGMSGGGMRLGSRDANEGKGTPLASITVIIDTMS